MRKSVDYLEKFERLMDEVATKEREPLTEREQKTLEVLRELTVLVRSQFTESYDRGRHRLVEELYFPKLCNVAEVHGARVDLEIDHNLCWGRLKYTCRGLLLDDTFARHMEILQIITAAADLFELSTSNGLVVMEFSFHLVKKQQIADHSEAIRRKTAELSMLST